MPDVIYAEPQFADAGLLARVRQWWPATTMMLCSALSYLDRQALAVLSPTILAAVGLDAHHYGEAISAFSIAYMLANPLWGGLLDRVGLRWGLAAAVFAWSLASGSHAWIAGFWGMVFARIALGVSEGATFPGCLRACADSLPPRLQSRGIAWAYSGLSIGAIITPLLVTPVTRRVGWRGAFIVTALAGLAWIVLWLATIRPGAFAHEKRATTLRLPDPREMRFWALVGSYGVGGLPLAIILYLAPLYLTRGLGLTQVQLNHVFWIPPTGFLVGGLFWGWVCDRFTAPLRHPFFLLLVLGILSLPLVMITHTHSLAAVLALMTDAIFVNGGVIIGALRIAMPTYPADRSALVGSVASASWSAMVAIAMPQFGALFDAHRYQAAFVITALLPAAGMVLWWFFDRLRTRAHA